MATVLTRQERAVRHVATLSAGKPLGAQARVTLNFHPDRLVRNQPVLCQLADHQDALDDYVEAHVHGLVRLDRDVEALVLDPSFRDTAVEAAAHRLTCPVEWHGGFRLSVGELRRHPDYRGPEYVELGAEIAVDGHLDPRIIGEAARTGEHDPQALKKVWHYLARYGHTA